ncbi:hypothetical protein [Actinoplanes philippinensis]|uniref:hypothetical protein n=1 Tax=Actinoplanes philippinensis TaxID=35752 RepID=UPI00340EC668
MTEPFEPVDLPPSATPSPGGAVIPIRRHVPGGSADAATDTVVRPRRPTASTETTE